MSAATRRAMGWLALTVVVVALLAVGASRDGGARTAADRVRDLGEVIRCPVCTGQSVAESDVSTAREIRSDIARRVDAGQTDDEIVASFEARYGSDILLNPPADGVAALVWVLPVVVALVGGVAVVVLTRSAGADRLTASDADRALVEELRRERAATPPAREPAADRAGEADQAGDAARDDDHANAGRGDPS